MADYQYVTENGVILPDTADLLAGVQDEFREAFGADLVVTPDTPQGVLITAEALARDAVVRNNAVLANQINPNLAGGVFLDALWALTGGARVAATFSLVTGALLTGQPNAIIPGGSQARVGTDGDIFELTGAVILDPTGNGVGTFQALATGPIAAAVGALDHIVSGVLGWETVTNPTAAVPGLDRETDAASRRRRRETLALQSVALPESITSGLFDTAGVRSVLFRENVTAALIVIEGVNLVAHSILAVVSGGTDEDVARTLLNRKSLGADWNGTTTVTIMEPVSGQNYDVKFQRPTLVPIITEVTVSLGPTAVIVDPEEAVREALLTYAEGRLESEDGWTIGTDASPFEMAAAINAAVPGLFVRLVRIHKGADPFATATIPITIIEQAQLIPGNVAVIVI